MSINNDDYIDQKNRENIESTDDSISLAAAIAMERMDIGEIYCHRDYYCSWYARGGFTKYSDDPFGFGGLHAKYTHSIDSSKITYSRDFNEYAVSDSQSVKVEGRGISTSPSSGGDRKIHIRDERSVTLKHYSGYNDARQGMRLFNIGLHENIIKKIVSEALLHELDVLPKFISYFIKNSPEFKKLMIEYEEWEEKKESSFLLNMAIDIVDNDNDYKWQRENNHESWNKKGRDDAINKILNEFNDWIIILSKNVALENQIKIEQEKLRRKITQALS